MPGILHVTLLLMKNGDSIGLTSNKSGWLHTFLSYISTFIILKKSASWRTSWVFQWLMYSSYSNHCLLDRLHFTMCSTFFGSCFSTSFFILLNKNGRRILCNLDTTVKLRKVFWFILMLNGFENHSLKSYYEENIDGIKKCIKDQSSITSFCRGVPVRSNHLFVLNRSRVCHLWDRKFLIFWASSKTM